MKHPPDDMLLAYVRQQQRDLWPVDLQEHVTSCIQCSERCSNFMSAGNVLEAWGQASDANSSYAMVSKRVMRAIHEPKVAQVERVRSGMARIHKVLPVGIVLCLLLSVLLVGWGVSAMGSMPKAKQILVPRTLTQTKATSVVATPTLGPIPTVADTPTVTRPIVPGNGVPTATPLPQRGAYIRVNDKLCTTAIDIAEDQMHVCGANFTPGTTVSIYYHIGYSVKKHILQVASNGTFIDVLYIQDCKSVPSSIYVQNVTKPSETAQITKDITFGACQG